MGHERERPAHTALGRRMPRAALAAIGTSIILIVVLGALGPMAGATLPNLLAGPTFPAAPPWPPWFVHAHPAPALVSVMLWLVEWLGGLGLVLGLLAVRRGWRPRPQRLIAGSILAVIALMVTPPVDNADPVMYAAFGRIAVLGHSPYVMTPGQLRATGDPVGDEVAPYYWSFPSRYGPVATVTEAAASELARDSSARTIFWMKVWNGLAYLALVLALDRIVRTDPARRIRAHLLWSLNPLMLLALMANGHNDVLAAAAGTSALFALRRVDSRRALLAGLLLGLAAATKAQYALFGAGLAWTARHSRRALTILALGAAAILIPAYLLAGRAAISATLGLTNLKSAGPWFAVAKLMGWQHQIGTVNILGLIASVVLAVILLWRMPAGPRDLPAIRIALALTLGLLVVSPLQYVEYDAMLFPLLAVMPATRLDWVVVVRAIGLAAVTEPYFTAEDPHWLTTIQITRLTSPDLLMGVAFVALLWLCITRAWNPATSHSTLPIETIPAQTGSTWTSAR